MLDNKAVGFAVVSMYNAVTRPLWLVYTTSTIVGFHGLTDCGTYHHVACMPCCMMEEWWSAAPSSADEAPQHRHESPLPHFVSYGHSRLAHGTPVQTRPTWPLAAACRPPPTSLAPNLVYVSTAIHVASGHYSSNHVFINAKP